MLLNVDNQNERLSEGDEVDCKLGTTGHAGREYDAEYNRERLDTKVNKETIPNIVARNESVDDTWVFAGRGTRDRRLPWERKLRVLPSQGTGKP